MKRILNCLLLLGALFLFSQNGHAAAWYCKMGWRKAIKKGHVTSKSYFQRQCSRTKGTKGTKRNRRVRNNSPKKGSFSIFGRRTAKSQKRRTSRNSGKVSGKSRRLNCRASQRNCMACTIQGEAGNQGRTGMNFVAQSIISRAKSRGKKICHVTRISQYEGNKRSHRKVSATALSVANAYMRKIKSVSKNGWDHFYAPVAQRKLGRKKPRWAYRFEKWGCQRKVVGGHVFYKSRVCSRKPGRKRVARKRSRRTRKRSRRTRQRS